MEKTESIRERLLSRLPQTDDIAAYKEGVAVLLAKHKRALFWDRMVGIVIGLCAVVGYCLATWVTMRDPHSLGPLRTYGSASVLLIVAAIWGNRNQVSQDQVNLLKEIKQLQVQMLELQAALNRKDSE